MIVFPPPALLTLPAAAVGLVMGSFVTALSYRQPRAVSVARGRSRCPACGHTLEARDLVPVLSWLVNRGACRHCGAPVSRRYPAIELATMILFTAGVWLEGDPLRLGLLALMTVVMMTLAVIDLEQQRLPDSLLLVLLAAAAAWRWSVDRDLAAGAAAGAALFALGVILDAAFRRATGRSGLGLGDSKLLAVAGVALPVDQLLLFLTIGGALGVMFGVLWLRLRRTATFPFGPPLLLAFWLSLAAAAAVLDQIIRHIGGLWS